MKLNIINLSSDDMASSLSNSKEKAEGFGDLSNQKKINNQRKRKK